MGEVKSKELETLRELLIVSLLRQDVSYEAISKATGINTKTLKNRYPLKMIKRRKNEG